MRRLAAKVLAFGLLGFLFTTESAVARTPIAIALPSISPGVSCTPRAINNVGDIVGTCRALDFNSTAVRWDKHRNIVALSPLPGYTDCYALGINTKGEVSGYCDIGSRDRTAVVWDRTGVPSALVLQGHDVWGGYDINDRGEVLITVYQVGYGVIDRDGDFRLLEPLDDDSFVEVRAINNRGQVAGSSVVDEPGGPSTAIRWGKKGVAKPLLPLDEKNESRAVDINNLGEIVGSSGLITNYAMPTATFWERDGTARVPLPLPGDDFSEANGVNRQGEAVGESRGEETR